MTKIRVMTHILSKITIRNFRSIRNETFELSAFTPLVGYNNAGKSNMLEATKWLLRKSALTDSSFHNTSLPIEIDGVITGITETILDQLSGALGGITVHPKYDGNSFPNAEIGFYQAILNQIRNE